MVDTFLLGACLLASSMNPTPARRICQWSILGTFAPRVGDGYEEDFLGGEAEHRAVLGQAVGQRTWTYFDDRLYCRNQDDYNDLYTFYMEGREGGPGGSTSNRVAYCACSIWSPQAREAALFFSANDRGKVWLNHRLVLAQSLVLQAMRDQQSCRVELRRGWNVLLVKVVNHRRIWGFYLSVAEPAGQRLDGLEQCPGHPGEGGELEIVTQGLPAASKGQPYVELTVRNPSGQYPWDNASASPFRFAAMGGTPPYAWEAEGLPEGLSLDPVEGEIRGSTSSCGEHPLIVRVRDGAPMSDVAARRYVLRVLPRPTQAWWETGTRLGGLRHHGEGRDLWTFDHAREQVDLMKRMGYSWQAYTIFSAFELDDQGQVRVMSTPEMRRYRQALLDGGIRFCQYMSFRDGRALARDLKAHGENMHHALEQCMTLYEPSLWFLDEVYGRFRQEGQRTMEFDALYSLIRTIDPQCLITMNADVRAQDYEVGDVDIVQVHGSYKVDAYWGHWPPHPPLGNNPKILPVDSWKLPWEGYMDHEEWLRALVTMLAEPANATVPRSFDMDPTPFLEEGHDTVALMGRMGDWLEPRGPSIFGTRPLADAEPNDWGYAVYAPVDGSIYLHVLENPFGKRGLNERRYLDLAPVKSPVREARVIPSGVVVPFYQEGERVSLDMKNVPADPVDTIILLSGRQPLK